MADLLNSLRGKKTYISAIVAGVLACLHALGHISDQQFQAWATLTGAAGLAALRAGLHDTVAEITGGAGIPPPVAK